MKKLAVSLILGASLAIAPSAFALTAMTDANMKSATAQAGVSIALDNVQIEQYIGSTRYTDDGVTLPNGTAAGGGSIVISERHTLQGFYALPCNGIDATGAPLTTNTFYESAFVARVNAMYGAAHLTAANVLGKIGQTHALTIDVGICPILSVGEYLNGNPTDISTPAALLATTTTAVGAGATAMTGVIIGLPTILCTTTADSYSVGVAATGGATAAKNHNATMITISQGPSATAVLSGTIEIAAH